MTTQLQRKQELHRLHQSGCFVLPNPWDLGGARVLAQLGFQALATTSSGFAWSRGQSDNASSLEEALAHFREIAEGAPLPVSADFMDCFAVDPSGVEKNVLAAAATGLAGLSIEDSTRDGATPLLDFALSVERVHAARSATRQSDADLVLTARSEGFIRGAPDLDETIRRLTAYADAGADCLYAPGLSTPEQIKAVVQAGAPNPVNVWWEVTSPPLPPWRTWASVALASGVRSLVSPGEPFSQRLRRSSATARSATWTGQHPSVR